MIITVAILVNIIAIGTQVETDYYRLRLEKNHIIIATTRVTSIVALPPILTSLRIFPLKIPHSSSQISSEFLSTSPFPPIPDGRMEQLMSPWQKAKRIDLVSFLDL